MRRETFSEKIQKAMSATVPEELCGGKWRGKAYSHIYRDLKDNFLDGDIPAKCNIKGSLFNPDREIKYHLGAAHMNSSQVACISFFKKFFEKESWEVMLLRALKNLGVPISSDRISKAAFEYEPCEKERTNFDFYFVLDNESHVSMEVKYTESEFGGISPDKKDPEKYRRKWKEIYKGLVEACPFLTCEENAFYADYQINRNIVYAKEGDVVLFLTPKANDAKGLAAGRDYIDSFTAKYPGIRNIYWEDLIAEIMKQVGDEPELTDYYGRFKKKYIDVL